MTSAKPPNVMAFSVLPVKYSPMIATSADSGIASAMISVERKLPMNNSTISDASTAPRMPSLVRLLIALRTYTDWSATTSRFKPDAGSPVSGSV